MKDPILATKLGYGFPIGDPWMTYVMWKDQRVHVNRCIHHEYFHVIGHGDKRIEQSVFFEETAQTTNNWVSFCTHHLLYGFVTHTTTYWDNQLQLSLI